MPISSTGARRNGAAVIGGGETARRGSTRSRPASPPRRRSSAATSGRPDGSRALLNLGHTFGHALEAETGFSDRLLHGEAVALGMALAFRFSALRGLCPPGGCGARSRASRRSRTFPPPWPRPGIEAGRAEPGGCIWPTTRKGPAAGCPSSSSADRRGVRRSFGRTVEKSKIFSIASGFVELD